MSLSTSETAVLPLAPVLDLNAAEPLRQSLMLLRGRAVTLDASRVTRLGGLCLQVLLAARAAWAEEGRAFALGSVSAEFADQMALFGNPELQFQPEGVLS